MNSAEGKKKIGRDGNGGVESEAGGRQASTITAPWLAHGTRVQRAGGSMAQRALSWHHAWQPTLPMPPWLRCSPECPALDGNQTGPKLRMVMGVTRTCGGSGA